MVLPFPEIGTDKVEQKDILGGGEGVRVSKVKSVGKCGGKENKNVLNLLVLFLFIHPGPSWKDLSSGGA